MDQSGGYLRSDLLYTNPQSSGGVIPGIIALADAQEAQVRTIAALPQSEGDAGMRLCAAISRRL
jgi:hypothetical protein